MRPLGFFIGTINLLCIFAPCEDQDALVHNRLCGVLGLFIIWLCIFGKQWNRKT